MDLQRPEMRDLLTLSLIPGLGPKLTVALIETFGSATEALHAPVSSLQTVPYIGPKLANAVASAARQFDIGPEIQLLEKHQTKLLPISDANYPEDLKHIPNPPPLLFYRGEITEADTTAVGIVGSRSCTSYGRRMARTLASNLVRKGYTVISGLARGIDGEAHQGALEAKGRTIAVLAGGLSKIYPPEHKELAKEIEQSGALLTEATMAQPPTADMFPARNRIISGLSQVVVIVEAAQKSGALITAHHAAEQGKTVLAFPGQVDKESSGGTNELIRQGAVLCRGIEDVLEEIEGVSPVFLGEQSESMPKTPPIPAGPPKGLDENQLQIWKLLEEGPKHVDELVQSTGIQASVISGILLMLEMKQIIRRMPGNRYELS